ncbi:acetylglucosaminyldiphospho-UDP acetyl-beta-D-mannosaminyltransferase [Methylophaga nitratireducenticrescens]|uniref:N-acetylmannosaminyltransferase n=1 Tax=Methylophaga nitratireducenticrescens TaxID=754476 RepID=I1XIQ2_METNJ|nr:WecB/TagA/CpsF family glycosyltransferase [Methylophaga nitratireducenticrescens]AFI84271.1 acetylglucosaminyldiphospho-UDP acetyl-beta-D-mannosaminyltransferase [Methylophaga nitratireducenticrescens]
MKKFHSPVWCVAGLPFHQMTIEQAVNYLYWSIEHKHRCFLSTPNLNFAATSQFDPDFYKSVIQSDLVVVDGISLLLTAKLLNIPIPERVAGSDIFARLSEQVLSPKIKVFFLGGEPGIAEKAHQQLNKSSQGMISCGFYDPGFVSVEEMSNDSIIEKINNSDPDFLVVALGAKKGQQWILRNQTKLNATVISHLGAVINFVAGHVKRAPEKWQRYGLEWLWRIRQEPKLLKRYFFDAITYSRLLLTQIIPLYWYSRYLTQKVTSHDYQTEVRFSQGEQLIVYLSGCVEGEYLDQLDEIFDDVLDKQVPDVIINVTDLKLIGADIVGRLLFLQGYLERQGRGLSLQGISEKLQRILRFSGVLNRFKLI